VGVTLYYLLTGKYSFNFPTQRDVEEVRKQDPKKFKAHKEALAWLMQANRIQHPFNIILTDTPTPVRDRDASIPKRLADVVDKAVRKEIGERYQSAAEFRAALNGAI
jgi:serine/threonine protein kinase